MSEKSFVALEQYQCFVCLKTYDTGAVLLDRRMRSSMDKYAVTGVGLCPEHQKQIDDGYVLLIGSADPRGDSRTGHIVSIRKAAFEQIFNTPVPPKNVAFVHPEVIAKLEALMKQEVAEE